MSTKSAYPTQLSPGQTYDTETMKKLKKKLNPVQLSAWFFGSGLILFLAFFFLKPTFVQTTPAAGSTTPTGKLDFWKALLYSIIGAAIVTGVVWLVA